MTTRPYKRSWKNLLINKRYQLRFTLFMVGLALVLMALLGWWVVRVADDATHVAESRQKRNPCAAVPSLMVTSPVEVQTGAMTYDDDPGSGAGSGSGSASGSASGSGSGPAAGSGSGPAAGSGSGSATGAAAGSDAAAPPRTIIMDEPTMRMELPPSWLKELKERFACQLAHASKIADLEHRKRLIVLFLVCSSAIVVVGLVLFGIKMTHRVAGPLYKVTLYLAKLRDGRYDKVYDLRRGDQLREFYEHFREAHAGVVTLERADRDRIAAALDAAAADGVLDRSPEAKAAAAELRAILERKEKALGH